MMNDFRPLIEDCCGWNRRIWADAVAFAVTSLPTTLEGKKVLEIGAGKHSSIAPAFAAKGATVFCSYYGQPRHEVENGRLRLISEKYGLKGIALLEMDMHRLSGRYDVIVLKSVLGGVCRGDDYKRMRNVIDGMMDHLTDDGVILTIDNGYVGPFIRLFRLAGAGKNRWTYFKQDELRAALADYHIESQGFGFLNFGAARFLFRRDLEFLETVNDAIHMFDTALLRLFNPSQRAVLSTVIRKKTVGDHTDARPARQSRIAWS